MRRAAQKTLWISGTLGFLVLLAGCRPTPHALPPEGPPLGTAAAWIATLEHEEGRPTRLEIDNFRKDAKAVCPSTLIESAKPRERRGCILVVSPLQEIRALEGLLRQTPRDHPDWILIVDRIAESAFALEQQAFRTCAELTVAEPRDRGGLASMARELELVRRNLMFARERSEDACDALARSAHETRAPCPFRAEKPAASPPPACIEEPRSSEAPPKFAPLCEAPFSL